ncbi:MAG: hypothetical protein AB8H79_24985 [Myxococcota bacterium]
MFEEIVLQSGSCFGGADQRYGLVDRVGRVGRRNDVRLVAWGYCGRRLRVVLEGDEVRIAHTVGGVRRGSARLSRSPMILVVESQEPIIDVQEAIVRCHRMPQVGDPLGSAWSSHRDLLSVRCAAFYDAARLRSLVDPRTIHWKAGGQSLPAGWPPNDGSVSLGVLLRIAAAVLGVLPADRRCFRLFAHAARSAGYDALSIASALALTPRRIRQLWAADEPALALALQHLGDPRLGNVP